MFAGAIGDYKIQDEKTNASNKTGADPTDFTYQSEEEELSGEASSQEPGETSGAEESLAALVVGARNKVESPKSKSLRKQDGLTYADIRKRLFKGENALVLAEDAVCTLRNVMDYQEEKGVRPNTALQANKIRAAEIVLAYIAGKPTQIVEQSGPDGEAMVITFATKESNQGG